MTAIEFVCSLSPHRRTLADAGKPCRDGGVGGVERLAELAAEVEPRVQHHVRQGETVSAQELLARHLPIEPLQAVRRDHLEARRSFRGARDALLEEFQGFAEAIAVR